MAYSAETSETFGGERRLPSVGERVAKRARNLGSLGVTAMEFMVGGVQAWRDRRRDNRRERDEASRQHARDCDDCNQII